MCRDDLTRIEEQSRLEMESRSGVEDADITKKSINEETVSNSEAIAALSDEQREVYMSALEGYVRKWKSSDIVELVFYRRCWDRKELCSSTNCFSLEGEIWCEQHLCHSIHWNCCLQHQRYNTSFVRRNW